MKAKLKFNLNDEQDRITFSRISKLSNIYSLLWQLEQELRIYAKQAEKEMLWFNLQCGLKYSNGDAYHKLNTKEK